MTRAADATMRWASAASTLPDTAAAADEVCAALAAALGDGPVDLALAFFTASHVPRAEALAAAFKSRMRPGTLAGASAHGVVSAEHEIESGPALSVIAARLPGVAVRPLVLVNEGWGEAVADPLAFARCAPGMAGAELVLMLGEPFSLDVESVLRAFDRHAPGGRVVGGMASAAPRPKGNALFLNDWVAGEGGIAIALAGALRVDVVVSQGCRAIGPTLAVTAGEGNVVAGLDGRPAVERLEQVLRELPEEERERLKHGLYVGKAARRGAEGRGDWLIRNLLGADRDRGVLAVGDHVQAGEKLRLHVRDAATAREDLELLLSPQAFDTRAEAALLFCCNGRGQGLYGAPDGDIAPLQVALGGHVPAAGMFCAGEIGPVGERNLLHGHTASIAVVRGKEAPRAE
ncbi:MAG: FIST C-terminal domain-containing protein [Candidatus Eisenbacteria bacterium]|nr:FIST C-terminal domain-containing protein [Candidatus Eisenbacteria bacterium]